MLARKTRSLPLSDSLIAEIKHNRGAYLTIMLVTEALLPFRAVEYTSWKLLSNAMPGFSLIRSRNTIPGKLKQYSGYFREALFQLLKNSTFLNIQLDIWSGGNGRSYLAISASFPPNILDEHRMSAVGDVRIILNNDGEPVNCHLLDFVDFSDKKHTGEKICVKVIEVLNEFGILHKAASITVDNATNNIAFHSHLINDHLKVARAGAFEQLDGVRLIRCASHVLSLQFHRIVGALMGNTIFEEAFSKITKLAEKLKWSPMLRYSLKNFRLPLIPLEPETRWIFKWRQVNAFLEHRKGYMDWYAAISNRPKFSAIKKHSNLFSYDLKELELLQYFVDCCSIFEIQNKQLQDSQINNISNGMSIYYVLENYYTLCEYARDGGIIPTSSNSVYNFSVLNGPSNLSMEEKQIVLNAILAARPCFQEYLNHFRKNPLYYVATALDPTSKFHDFHNLMTEDEANLKIQETDRFINGYLERCNTNVGTVSDSNTDRTSTPEGKALKFPIVRISNNEYPVSAHNIEQNASSEWDRYKKEGVIHNGSRTDAIQWWYNHRVAYPNLFKLALALLYSKISTSGVESIFSVSSKVLHKHRRSLSSENVKSVMLLRNHFKNFGLYDRKAKPMSLAA